MADKASSIYSGMAHVAEVKVASGEELDDLLGSATMPFIIRGLVSDWPLVQAGRKSGAAARAYLLDRNEDMPFTVSIGTSQEDGRLFYDQDMMMNVKTGRAKLPEIFKQIDASENVANQPIIYLASIGVKTHFSGLHEENNVDLGDRAYLASIWMGMRTRIAAHNDFPDNLACVAVGRRRFTLFPPDQFRNLYLGPLDNTPAGRVVSMVDFNAPDHGKYPRFKTALKYAQLADLSPGDAVFIPSMWWHHVEGLDPFNVLINYWWRNTPQHMGQPQEALNHAIMAIRDLPQNEKQHWRELFDHYVFENKDDVTAHIPENARGVLGPMTAENSKKLRTFLLRALSQ